MSPPPFQRLNEFRVFLALGNEEMAARRKANSTPPPSAFLVARSGKLFFSGDFQRNQEEGGRVFKLFFRAAYPLLTDGRAEIYVQKDSKCSCGGRGEDARAV